MQGLSVLFRGREGPRDTMKVRAGERVEERFDAARLRVVDDGTAAIKTEGTGSVDEETLNALLQSESTDEDGIWEEARTCETRAVQVGGWQDVLVHARVRACWPVRAHPAGAARRLLFWAATTNQGSNARHKMKQRARIAERESAQVREKCTNCVLCAHADFHVAFAAAWGARCVC
ncbi:hypothetical protein SVAN01_03111 [Stagonosporopsis vannaccii]|nr:hypothetical protein SVAN01_03111 [Stagonosporopsis vannaccii]